MSRPTREGMLFLLAAFVLFWGCIIGIVWLMTHG
jgi:hypothetical protein